LSIVLVQILDETSKSRQEDKTKAFRKMPSKIKQGQKKKLVSANASHLRCHCV